MGSNGSFAIGQLNAAGTIDYDIVPPLLGTDGERHTPLSTNGYVIAADSEHPAEAWALLQALTAPDFLASTWGKPGHAVPARRSVASSVVDTSHAPANQAADPRGDGGRARSSVRTPPGRGDAYGRTVDLFTAMNTGALADPGRAGPDRGGGERCARRRPRALTLGSGVPGSVARAGRVVGRGRERSVAPLARTLVLPPHLARG